MADYNRPLTDKEKEQLRSEFKDLPEDAFNYMYSYPFDPLKLEKNDQFNSRKIASVGPTHEENLALIQAQIKKNIAERQALGLPPIKELQQREPLTDENLKKSDAEYKLKQQEMLDFLKNETAKNLEKNRFLQTKNIIK